MYVSDDDEYCYSGTRILRNRLDLRSQVGLERYEAAVTGRRFLEPMPHGRLMVRHYRRVHHHIFQDVYDWAGCFRTVRIGKGRSLFCYPEHIATEMVRVFGELQAADYLRGRAAPAFAAGAAHFLADLNAIHAFRDGNGRAQLAFMAILSSHAGHALALERLDPTHFLEAMIASFEGREDALAEQLLGLISPLDV